jgi:cytoskeletal protein RodZ
MPEIGTSLREARMRARIDITEVERATKIRARYLRAIENEEWDALPGPVYVKSFLRTYSDYLGLDSRVLVDEFKRRFERPSDHEPRSVSTLHRERERAARGPLLPPWALIGLVLIGVVVALYVLGTLGSSKKSPPAPVHPRVVQRAKPKPRHHHTTLPVTPTQVTLRLVPTDRVYVCVVDGHGKKLIPGLIFAAGQTVPTEKASKLLVTLGNNSVHMTVNGKAVPVPASASAIGFELTPQATKPLAGSAQPTSA